MRFTGTKSTKRRIINVDFMLTDQAGALTCVHSAIENNTADVFAFCNMHTLNLAQRNAVFADVLTNCTVFNDGLGIDIASRILYKHAFPFNLNGTDLTSAILQSTKRPISVFLVGGKPGVADQAAVKLANDHPMIAVVGAHHGYFDLDQSHAVFEQIRAARADLVLVGMGNPRQEHWAVHAAKKTGCVMLCVGAFIDFAAGRFPRAPEWVRRARCEWAFRLTLEPRRLASRYFVGGGFFGFVVMREWLKGKVRRAVPHYIGTELMSSSQEVQ